MLFNSLVFVAFFGVVYSAYRLLPHRGQNVLLLVASWFFYGWWNWRFLGLLILTTFIDWSVGLALDRQGQSERGRRVWVTLSVIVNLGILATFKYFGFFAAEVNASLAAHGIRWLIPFPDLVLPVGLSFYTFQSMAYTIDVYRRDVRATRSFWQFALFVSFFPQLVAGPIERSGHLIPQLEQPRRVTSVQLAEGTQLILWGFFKKLFVADNMAALVSRIFEQNGPDCWSVLVGAWAFCWQIYGDFSGYSDIARGLGKWMGIELSVNFRLPFFASSPRDLWRRWHISLSQWLRDYLYVPLGGDRKGRGRTYVNLLTTMALGGLWHGANWTFIVWGVYHGAALAVQRALPTFSLPRVARPLAIIATFQFTALGFLIFRADSMTQVKTMVSTFLHVVPPGAVAIERLGQMLVIITPLLLVEGVQYVRDDPDWLLRIPRPIQAVLCAALFLATVFLGSSFDVQFIYFQF